MAQPVVIRNLNKLFDSPDGKGNRVHAVQDINLVAKAGQLVTLLGPSGCGKTTLLRMIAGFEEPSSGDILFGEKRMNDIAPNRRDAAMVFQSYAIFPHLTVYENVVFGLRLKGLSAAELKTRAERVMELTGLTKMAQRSPNQMSGGQQQRVALARAIVMEPAVLLFDEPLSNLDAKLRETMRVEIRAIQQRLGITALYVTHDQVEAMSISDLVVVMNGGVVEQIGAPIEIYTRPASRFVADFIGKANFVAARVTGAGELEIAGNRYVTGQDDLPAAGSEVSAVLRPEAITLSAAGGEFRGSVKRVTFLGNVAEYLIEVEGQGEWLVDISNPGMAGVFPEGSQVGLSLVARSIHAPAR
ncbi:ABC transporter ATP-binding protein [Falsigemmobacter faecalis]|uniref:ABC transporter ATP-binding protein n=1 Tax=Falsigemmobacter faecalis TaxID=2488730 RepID=A0A3P3DVR0_9RHOB|nr:ABC transporter ATP-binding protein [Falsigemmobacter faecalis]RRH78255.1 ABC transporter ATP-binding protein [Falsigemmobacter faecalis]